LLSLSHQLVDPIALHFSPTRRSSDLGRLDRGIQGQHVGLGGKVLHRTENLTDLPRGGLQSLHAALETTSGEIRKILGTVQNFSRSEEHTSELQSREKLVCRLPLEKKK